jgi:ferric-dicitrate binding protein FerR (iron transport regulator)
MSGGQPSEGGRLLIFPVRLVPRDPARPVPGARFRLAWLLVPAALGAIAGAYAVRERAVTFQVVSGRVSDGGYVSSGAADAIVRFSDRSDLGLEPGTRLRISDLQVRGARVMLEGGAVHVNVHAQPPGSWTLDAGPYIVHLTGGQLDVAWNPDVQQIDLRVHDGSAIVEGPVADSWLKVGADQHVLANAKTGALSVDRADTSPPSL